MGAITHARSGLSERLSDWWNTSSGIERWFSIIVFLMPTLTLVHKSGSSVAYTLLLLPSLFLFWGGWAALSKTERHIVIASALLFISACISLYISESPDEGIKRLERFFRLFSIIFFIMLLRKVNLKLGMVLMYGILLSLAFIFGHALFELPQGGDRLQGTFYPIFYGDYVTILLGLLVAYAANIPLSRLQFALVAAASASLLIIIMLSGTRGAWLYLPAIPMLYLLYFGLRGKNKKRIALITLLFLVTAAVTTLNTPQIAKRINAISSEVHAYMDDPSRVRSIGARVAMWSAAIDIWRDNPVFGSGLGNYNKEVRERIGDGRIKSRNITIFTQAHSIYFHSLAALGTIGTLLMILFSIVLPLRSYIAASARHERSRANFYALAGITVITAYAVFGLTETWYTRNPFINVFVVYTAVFLTSLPRKEANSVT